jgi:pyruvate dehydrogenase E1 component alpha subunit
VNQGQVNEAFNMAGLWDLPVIYVIENNRYGMGTSVSRASAAKELYRLGEPYGMPGEQVDGMNVIAVREAAAKAVKYCRAGNGPYVLEMMTYRYRGHSMSDPAKYRPKEEVAEMREQFDPIANLSKVIISAGYKSEDELKELDREVREIVAEAAEFAQQSPEPNPSELYTDVMLDA